MINKCGKQSESEIAMGLQQLKEYITILVIWKRIIKMKYSNKKSINTNCKCNVSHIEGNLTSIIM